MLVSGCLEPITIKDTIRGGYRTMSCGKCAGCLTLRNYNLANLIERERLCYKYCYFVTLTYTDSSVPILQEYLPSYVYHPLDRSKNERRTISNYFLHKGYFFENWTSYDRKVYDRYHELLGGVPVLSHRDLTSFFKKFNNLIYYDRKRYKQSSIRYFGVGEYGPATFRPHYHLFLFFDSSVIESEIEKLIYQSWSLRGSDVPLGRFEYRPDSGKTGFYTSSYANLSVQLPTFLRFPFLRPFSVRSSRPAFGKVGSDYFTEKEIFFSGAPTFTFHDKYYTQQNNTSIILPKCLESRLFPRLQFSQYLTTHERLYLYSRSFVCESFKRFFESVVENQSPTIRRYLKLSDIDSISPSLYPKLKDVLFRLWSASVRFRKVSQRFGIPLTMTLYFIDNYYSNKQLFQLKQFYEFQQTISLSSSIEFENPALIPRLYTDSLDKIPIAIASLPLSVFNHHRLYKSKVLKFQADSKVRKHAGDFRRNDGRALLFK